MQRHIICRRAYLRGQPPWLHLFPHTARMHQRCHRRTLQPCQAISVPLQVPLHHMVLQVRMLLPRNSTPYRLGIKCPIKHQHGLLLPWGSRRKRPHRPLHRRVSLSGSRGVSATTRSDILPQDHTVCERIYLRDGISVTHPVHLYVQMAPFSNRCW